MALRLLAVAVGVVVLAAAALAAPKPNFVFILIDDLGYNEIGYMNTSRGILTPNIDRLASTGVRFKQYYVQPICSPTRSALLTGKYPIRLGTQGSVIFWDTPFAIGLEHTFTPKLLKSAGYKTAMYGKWHLGMYQEKYEPQNRGFDDVIGYLQGCGSKYTHIAACCSAGSPTHDQDFVCHGPYTGYDWFVNGTPDPTANHTNSCDLIRDKAIGFLEAQTAEDPFFLYLPFQNIHAPYTCDQQYRDLYANRTDLNSDEQTVFGAISEVDAAIGKIMATLEASPLYKNTVVIFSSDNGAPPHGGMDHQHGTNPGWIARNYPFRGYKTQIWEGGCRVVGFVHSPLLPAEVQNSDTDKLFHVTDWLPTMVGLAGAEAPANLDGHDIWAAITNKDTPSPRTEMLYNINPLVDGQAGPPKAGVRQGDFKLLTWGYTIAGVANATTTGPVNCPASAKNCDPAFQTGPVLYNLATDPAETTNVAAQHPDVVAQLLKRLEFYAAGSVYPMSWKPPYQGPDYACAKCPLHPPLNSASKPWGPWL